VPGREAKNSFAQRAIVVASGSAPDARAAASPVAGLAGGVSVVMVTADLDVIEQRDRVIREDGL
jgi:hypothetical protein